ncbi:hypothetical protein FRP1_29035 (plasmid) [Pseudonocardia sp. EC080625-04]|uniref:TetR/AcrR family transcriptional regulator C-terminal domain-containing protein n=1 Tax=Pseudonocardia sp. EC080625-04 TaxID=1096868 RepID=UPI0006CB5283|nr:TetR/AcrR family transcriptional regulator C-terminal domain-containing protein [Pseudonocardia sp. EC080625-04]ALE76838.1 hypothetical protein FRP1_29035 [Pseudonocardia sp. EC080625-04]
MAVDRLSREQIVCAAIALLDADGVDGLSMRQLGSRLGSGATSVYWHVGNKDNLVALAADAVFGEVDLPDPAEIGWRDAIVASSHGLRNVILRHRWLIPVLGAHPTINGKHIASYQNHALTACELAGFSGHDLDWAGGTVLAFVVGAVWGETSSTAPALGENAGGDAVAQAREHAREHPKLLERYDALMKADPEEVREQSFTFGLRTILDGLAAQLRNTATSN